MDLEQAGNLTAWALPVFALLIAAEVGLSAWRGRSAYETRDFLGSMSQLAGNIVVQLVTKGAILALYLWLYQYRLFTIENTLLNLAVLAVVIDFQFYWYHRTSHRVRLFWAVHVAHHSSEYMNYGTALRQSWFGPLTKPFFYWPIPLIGFDPLAIFAVGAVLTIYGFWTHTEQVRSIGWLDKIFVSPAHHRVHHGSNDAYIDKNFANFLIIWDKIFGTFQDEEEQVRYGLTHNINTYNPLRIATHEFAAIKNEVLSKTRRRPILAVLFGTPESAEPPRG